MNCQLHSLCRPCLYILEHFSKSVHCIHCVSTERERVRVVLLLYLIISHARKRIFNAASPELSWTRQLYTAGVA